MAEERLDEIEAWLNRSGANSADGNVSEGIKRDALTAMQLRVAPILNEFQDRIFRLPIDNQIAVLGPPGTGKTTTLVRRLRQKVDFAYLDTETERPLVENPDSAGLAHADSWVMFTPTELLRLYVKEAFGKEGVPVHDERLRTWDDYRREIGRRSLRILRTGTGAGLVLRDAPQLLLSNTLSDQIDWFEAFDAHQRRAFVEQLSVEARRLADAIDQRAATLGRQVSEAVVRSADKPLQLLGELAALSGRLRATGIAQRDETRAALLEPLRAYSRENPGFLDKLTGFVETLGEERPDDDDDDAAETDDDEVGGREPTFRGPRLAQDIFVKAMRSRAIAQASGRTPAGGTRAGKLLTWLREQDLTLPDLKRVGDALLVQRAALRIARAANDYITRIPQRYRRFRREMREQHLWYGEVKSEAFDAHPAEVDLIILAMLRAARGMESDRLLAQRLAERMPPMLDEIARLRRHQVLVDEATDFSPVQLACMRALAHPRTESFFLSGDFNQRLTSWGTKSIEQLRWVSPAILFEPIDIAYRQSRKLAGFARELARLHNFNVTDQAPEHIDNTGWEPAIGLSLATLDDQTLWLSERIRKIDQLTDGVLPTIAVLVADPATMEPLAERLSHALEDMNILAVACPKGLVKGQVGDVRLFEVEHIKGLEFEAVFFIDIDALYQCEPDLFDRYIYVGATRAATFLGLGCRSSELPGHLAGLQTTCSEHW